MATWKNFFLQKSVVPTIFELRLGKKSDILHCLEDKVDAENTNSVSDAVLDGAAIVNMLKPGLSKTFNILGMLSERCWKSQNF